MSQTNINTGQTHPVNALILPRRASPYRASGLVRWLNSEVPAFQIDFRCSPNMRHSGDDVGFEYRRYRRPLLTRGLPSMMDPSSG